MLHQRAIAIEICSEWDMVSGNVVVSLWGVSDIGTLAGCQVLKKIRHLIPMQPKEKLCV